MVCRRRLIFCPHQNISQENTKGKHRGLAFNSDGKGTWLPHSPQRTNSRGVPGEQVLAVSCLVAELWDPILHQRVTVEEDGGGDRLGLIFPTLGGRGKHHIQIATCPGKESTASLPLTKWTLQMAHTHSVSTGLKMTWCPKQGKI